MICSRTVLSRRLTLPKTKDKYKCKELSDMYAEMNCALVLRPFHFILFFKSEDEMDLVDHAVSTICLR